MKEDKPCCLAVVRVRGTVDVRGEVEDTLHMLNLKRPFNATLIPNTPQYLGMLRKTKDRVTWGPVSKDIISLMLKKRGRIIGKKRITDSYVKEVLGFDSIDKLASSLHECKVTLNKLKMKPVFTLHPPSKGFKRSIKRSYAAGGELGDRGEGINELLKRMI